MSNSNCYKTEDCKESYCIEQTSICYKIDDCKFDYCIDPLTKENKGENLQTETGQILINKLLHIHFTFNTDLYL
jgi:hypothetical protein